MVTLSSLCRQTVSQQTHWQWLFHSNVATQAAARYDETRQLLWLNDSLSPNSKQHNGGGRRCTTHTVLVDLSHGAL